MRLATQWLIRHIYSTNRLFFGFRDELVLAAWNGTDIKLGAEPVVQQRARMSKLWVKILAPTVAWKCSHPLAKQRESPSTRLR